MKDLLWFVALIVMGVILSSCSGAEAMNEKAKRQHYKVYKCERPSWCMEIDELEFYPDWADSKKTVFIRGTHKKVLFFLEGKDNVEFAVLSGGTRRIQVQGQRIWASKFTLHNLTEPGEYMFKVLAGCDHALVHGCGGYAMVKVVVKPPPKPGEMW